MTENVLQTLFLLQTFFLSVDLIGPRKSTFIVVYLLHCFLIIEIIFELQKC